MHAKRTRTAGTPLDMLAIAQRVAETTSAVPPAALSPVDSRQLVDARGYPRAIATRPGHGAGRSPKNKGQQYPPTPPTTEEVARMLEHCGHGPNHDDLRRAIAAQPARLPTGLRDEVCGLRMRGLIVVLWRSGLRVSEALALTEQDFDERNRTIVVRHGKGGKRRLSGMDEWGWEHLQPWIDIRTLFPAGSLFCVVDGPTAGRQWADGSVRHHLKRLAADVGIRHRVAPHQLRHAHATELAREGIPLHLVSRQLGHANLAITTQYLRAIAPEEVIGAIAARRPPMIGIGGPR